MPLPARSKREYLQRMVAGKNEWSRPLTNEERALGFLGWHERGYLPHSDFPNLVQFITFRLDDSMPASRQWGEWEHLLQIEDVRDRRTRLEDYLDRGFGECYLRKPGIAKLTENALLYFHSDRYGHSRDHRSDRPQIILAVATDTDGLPLHISILRGNRNDTQTLQGLLQTLHRRFGITEATFVFDGGMSSQLNLAVLTEAKLAFVTRLSTATLQTLVSELGLEKQLELGDDQRLLEAQHEGKRYVIAGGPWRQQRDQERRQSRLTKAETELRRLAAVKRKRTDPQKLASQVGRSLQRLKAHKYFTYQVDTAGRLQWARKEEIITQEAQQDGWYLLHTNEPAERCTGEQVLAHYKGLLDVEEAFCELKSYLEVRPVHHRRPDRVINHVRLCFLAYWLSARLGARMARPGRNPRSAAPFAPTPNHSAGNVARGAERCPPANNSNPKKFKRATAKIKPDAALCRAAQNVGA